MKAKPIPSAIRESVRSRSDGRCEIVHDDCTYQATEMHHILTRSHGGKHLPSNLLHVCGTGHRYIHSNPSLAYERGWLQRSGIQ